LKNFLVDLKNSNIELVLSTELLNDKPYVELPTFAFSSSGDTGYSGNLSESQGSNNPGISETPSDSGQSGNSGSNNNNGSPDPIPNFDNVRRNVGAKLRDLFVNRPPRSRILMTDPNYADRINS
jgi:hypothetical protein